MPKLLKFWRDLNPQTRLLYCALGSGLIYLAFTAPFLLHRYFAVSPPVDYAKLTHHSPFGFAAYVLGILTLFGIYWAALRTLSGDHDAQAIASLRRTIFIGGFIFAGTLIFSYPQTAIDLLVYALRTRGWALYGLSPFAISPDAFPAGDPWLSLAGEWADAASPYGPLWEWISLAGYHLSGGNYLGQLFAVKIFSALAYLGTAALVYLALRQLRPAWALAGAAFFAWNPLVLFESIANAHNDIIMVFFLMLAVWAYLRYLAKPALGLALVFVIAFTASILIKFVTLLILPFFIIGFALYPPRHILRRLVIPLLILLAVLTLVVALMAFYWPGWEDWAVLQAGQGAGRSITALLVLALRPYAGSIAAAFDLTSGLIYLIFGILYLWAIWRVTRPANTQRPAVQANTILASFYIFFGYAFFVATVFHAWYLLWFMPLAALLIPDHRVLSSAFVFSLMALLIIPYYETIRVWFPLLNQNHLLGHAIGVPLLCIPVLFVLWKPPQDLQLVRTP